MFDIPVLKTNPCKSAVTKRSTGEVKNRMKLWSQKAGKLAEK
jgi:hypothetical protein